MRTFLRTAAMTVLAAAIPAASSCSRKGHPAGKPEEPVLPRKNYDTARLFNGVTIHSSTESAPSGMTALETAADKDSYLLDLELHVRWPKPATTVAEIARATPALPELLPLLPELLERARPSPDFATLQRNKEKALQSNLTLLQRLFPRDSLFDCQTILEIGSPRALLIQAIMNVNADGSDGDRNLGIEKLSPSYQPQTNYRWHKASDHPNPMLRESEAREALTGAELGNGTLSGGQLAALKREHDSAQATVAELKRWSFLVGSADPFIVLPSFMVKKGPGRPSVGDYAVVIARGVLYPAVVGDLGPNSKIGEASLRICREIDPGSGEEHRPASTPGVVYLVFPGSADKPLGTPDYVHWSERCHALWMGLGGREDAPWHEWTSLEKPWPTPSPVPTPSPFPSPIPSGIPSPIPEPSPTAPVSSGTNDASPQSAKGSSPVPQISPPLSTNPVSTSTLPSPGTNL
jgi:hypothetical protein